MTDRKNQLVVGRSFGQRIVEGHDNSSDQLASFDKDKYSLTLNQNSGFNSDASQNQQLNIGDHYHLAEAQVYNKLVAIHNSPITFEPSSLRDVILAIDDGISIIENCLNDFSTGIDINLKNEINNHSKEYFENFVEIDFYPQFYKLDKFFELKENQQSLQPKVDNVIRSLNRQIIAFQGDEKFECILLKICSKLIDSNHHQLSGKDDEILLILYYFYCNCCIGKKTKEEKSAVT